MHDVVMVGGGGLAREYLSWARRTLASSAFRWKGYLALRPETPPMGDLEWLGDERAYQPGEQDRLVMAIGSVEIRKRVAAVLKGKGGVFLTLVHESALVAPTAKIGEGVVVCPYAIINDSVTVGDFATLNYHASCGHDSRVGDFSYLSPYAALGGGAVLEEGGFLGISATIAPYVTVGAGSKVAANSVALRDAPTGSLTIGVPGRSMPILEK